MKERKAVVKKLKHYITGFDYTDKILIVLSATVGGVSVISHVNIIGIHAGIESSTFILTFSLTTRIIKKLLNETRQKKKKHSKIIMLAKSNLMSRTIINLEINHEEFKMIID